jgi:hypothetical protein
MSDTNVVVVNKSSLPLEDVTPVVNAINYQIQKHLSYYWEATGYVAAIQDGKPIPADHYVLELEDKIADPTLGGVHYFNERGRVFATVPVQQPVIKDDGTRVPWSLSLSHEILEMIIDPYGERTFQARSLDGETLVDYLAEVCDPCQHLMHARMINDVVVSDFYTREYFDTSAGNHGPFSAYKTITKPLEILPGGYLCWRDKDMRWFRADWDGSPTQVTQRELFDFRLLPSGSLRERVDFFTNSLGASGPGAKLEKLINKRFSRRITAKLKEIEQAQAYHQARTSARDEARARHQPLSKRLPKKMTLEPFMKQRPKQVKLCKF